MDLARRAWAPGGDPMAASPVSPNFPITLCSSGSFDACSYKAQPKAPHLPLHASSDGFHGQRLLCWPSQGHKQHSAQACRCCPCVYCPHQHGSLTSAPQLHRLPLSACFDGLHTFPQWSTPYLGQLSCAELRTNLHQAKQTDSVWLRQNRPKCSQTNLVRRN